MRTRLAVIILLAFIAGGGLAILSHPQAFRQLIAGKGPGGTGAALIGGPFALTDHNGRRVTEKDFKGKLALVYFGFTYCPDVCPAGLQTISAALDALGPKAGDVAPLFVTVDPARDTPAALKDYLANFSPRILGLTGTEKEIGDALRAYRVFARKVEDKASPGAYTVDHTSLIYLMDREGRYLAHFRHNAPPAEIASGIAGRL